MLPIAQASLVPSAPSVWETNPTVIPLRDPPSSPDVCIVQAVSRCPRVSDVGIIKKALFEFESRWDHSLQPEDTLSVFCSMGFPPRAFPACWRESSGQTRGTPPGLASGSRAVLMGCSPRRGLAVGIGPGQVWPGRGHGSLEQIGDCTF